MDATGLRRVLELTMAAFCRDFLPAVGFEQLHGVTNLWHGSILPRRTLDVAGEW